MITLKKIGYFNGFNKQDICGHLTEESSNYKVSEVVKYLTAGIKIYSWLEYVDCMYSCTVNNIGSTEYSDGEWVWTSEFIHYVEFHNIKIPGDFLHSLELNNYCINENSNNFYELKKIKGDPTKIETGVRYSGKEWRKWLLSFCPQLEINSSSKVANKTEYISAEKQREIAKSKGFDLPEGW